MYRNDNQNDNDFLDYNNNNNKNNNNNRNNINIAKMAKRSQVTERHSAEIGALYQKAGVSGAKLLELFPEYSKAAIYRHAKTPMGQDVPCDKRKHNKGRPSKLAPKDKRRILHSVPKY